MVKVAGILLVSAAVVSFAQNPGSHLKERSAVNRPQPTASLTGEQGDIGAKVNAAIAALPKNSNGYPEGRIILPYSDGGIWATTVTVSSPGVSIVGQGPSASVFNCTVQGDCLRITTSPFTVEQAGEFKGFRLNGTNAENAVGIHLGDIVGARFTDIVLSGFTGSKSACLWMDNVTHWTERNVFEGVHCNYDTYGVRFTVEPTGTACPTDGGPCASFGYNHFFDLRLNIGDNQTGFSLEGSAGVYNGTIRTTINREGRNSIVFHLQDTARIIQEEMHVFGEGNQRTGLIFDLGPGTYIQAYGEVAVGFDNVPNNIETPAYVKVLASEDGSSGSTTSRTAATGRAVCWKEGGTLGYCSTAPDDSGTCNCN